MLTIWKRAPLLRLCVPYIAGIFACDFISNNVLLPCAVMLVALVFVVVGYKAYQLWFTQRHWMGIGLLCVFFALGWLRASWQNNFSKAFAKIPVDTELSCLVKLLEGPVERDNSFRMTGQIYQILQDSSAVELSANVLIYLAKSTSIEGLERDDFLMIHGSIRQLSGPMGPGEFDMKMHYRRKGIVYQMYSDSSNWKLLTKPNNHSMMYYLEKWRRIALDQMSKFGVRDREYGVLAALILGDTGDMDKELMASYASAGVVHVLAVSGLHVGLVYVLLAPIFKWLFGRSRGRWFRTLAPMAVLWLYSALTGGTPSVLRAAVMFSGFIFADNFGKHNNIYNTLASSAFLLLMVRPNMIFDLGFQLSYLAVIGIVVLQRPIYLLLQIRNKWIDKIWSLTSVSLSAQLVTLPLTLYYFHQFPNYFLASNLFIIPWSTLLIYVSIFFYACLPWPSLASLVAKVMIWMTQCMNNVIVWFDHLPGSVTSNISCNLFQATGLSACLFFGLRWLFWKKTKSLITLLGIAICCVVGQWVQFNQTMKQQIGIFHCGKKSWFVSQIVADSAFVYSANQMEEANYGFKNYLLECGVEQPADSILIKGEVNPYQYILNTSFYFADSTAINNFGLWPCDVIVLYNLGRIRIDKNELANLRNCQIWLDHSISRKRQSWMSKQLDESVDLKRMQKGAYRIENGNLFPYSAD